MLRQQSRLFALEIHAETQPQLHPALLRLSAMKRVVDAIEGVTAVLLFAGCALAEMVSTLST